MLQFINFNMTDYYITDGTTGHFTLYVVSSLTYLHEGPGSLLEQAGGEKVRDAPLLTREEETVRDNRK